MPPGTTSRAATGSVGTLLAMQRRATLLHRLAAVSAQRGRPEASLEKLREFCNLVENRILAHSAFQAVAQQPEFEALMVQFLEAKQELVCAGWETHHRETPSPSSGSGARWRSPSVAGTRAEDGCSSGAKSPPSPRSSPTAAVVRSRLRQAQRGAGQAASSGTQRCSEYSPSPLRWSQAAGGNSYESSSEKEGEERARAGRRRPAREDARERLVQVSAQKERAARHRRALRGSSLAGSCRSRGSPGGASEASSRISGTEQPGSPVAEAQGLSMGSTPAEGAPGVRGELRTGPGPGAADHHLQQGMCKERYGDDDDEDLESLPGDTGPSLLTFLSDIAAGLARVQEVHTCVLDIQASLARAASAPRLPSAPPSAAATGSLRDGGTDNRGGASQPAAPRQGATLPGVQRSGGSGGGGGGNDPDEPLDGASSITMPDGKDATLAETSPGSPQPAPSATPANLPASPASAVEPAASSCSAEFWSAWLSPRNLSPQASSPPSPRLPLVGATPPPRRRPRRRPSPPRATQEVHVICSGGRAALPAGVLRQGVKAQELFRLSKEVQDLSVRGPQPAEHRLRLGGES
eukprot:jgi/Tetstr1/431331/TSEL_021022.t1